ncbi:MAG: hypothetical protein HOG89_01785 [Candidatus Peribacter sp.]|jgi:hypothetical protein|nr:hypothetical protein [Candidatus Peribacter sp.]MBT4392828.1 hypothetical protein [Candidatus Peribacter sp.]MBT4601459.1 hypothetical protein [Candidatus Peribacter sp.]MBT5148776.1 hypothetical protein [Candidatus Peribacter sp.]MBT5637628.1 hypothetical protein [Candidatus Peribacter sp.]
MRFGINDTTGQVQIPDPVAESYRQLGRSYSAVLSGTEYTGTQIANLIEKNDPIGMCVRAAYIREEKKS